MSSWLQRKIELWCYRLSGLFTGPTPADDLEAYQAMIARYEHEAAIDPTDHSIVFRQANAMMAFGHFLIIKGKRRDGIEQWLLGTEKLKKLTIRYPAVEEYHAQTAAGLIGLSTHLHSERKYDESERLLDESLSRIEGAIGRFPASSDLRLKRATAMWLKSFALDRRGRYAESLELKTEVCGLYEKEMNAGFWRSGPDIDMPRVYVDLARAQAVVGEDDKALVSWRRAFELCEKQGFSVHGFEVPEWSAHMADFAGFLCQAGCFDEAMKFYRKACSMVDEAHDFSGKQSRLLFEARSTGLILKQANLFSLADYTLKAEPMFRAGIGAFESILSRPESQAFRDAILLEYSLSLGAYSGHLERSADEATAETPLKKAIDIMAQLRGTVEDSDNITYLLAHHLIARAKQLWCLGEGARTKALAQRAIDITRREEDEGSGFYGHRINKAVALILIGLAKADKGAFDEAHDMLRAIELDLPGKASYELVLLETARGRVDKAAVLLRDLVLYRHLDALHARHDPMLEALREHEDFLLVVPEPPDLSAWFE